jgi:hypothetical protein
MKRSKGLAGQMAEQMYIPKNAAKGMLAKAKKMNDRDGFMGGGSAHSSGVRRLQQSKINRNEGGVARRAGAAIRGFSFEGIF